jgi:uncharacterized protein DUF4386
MRTIKKQARIAGAWYLLLFLVGPVALKIVPDRLFVFGNATETAARVVSQESLLRMGMASELFGQVAVIFLALALFRLFRGVSESLSRQLLALGALVSVPIAFVTVVFELAALILFKGGGFLTVFDKAQLDALGYLFIRMHGSGIMVASIFWGLWLIPFGMLVVRSRFMPRIIGYLLFAGAAGYLSYATAAVLFPAYASQVGDVAKILEIGEIPIVFWLAIWGATGPKASEPVWEPQARVSTG